VPRLPADPAQRRQAVGPLVERAEGALGAERPPHALDDDLEPAFGEQPPEDQAEDLAATVRRAHQHRRLRPVAHVARDVAVGEQHGAVVHRRPQVALHDEIVGASARQPHAAGEDLAEKRHRRVRVAMLVRPSPREPPGFRLEPLA
jgi:hypothetical protein